MRLHPRTVELPLQRRFPQLRHRVADVLRGLRQHRKDRLEQLHTKAIQSGGGLPERSSRHWCRPACDHGCPPDYCEWQPAGSRNSFQHQPFQRALAQLAEQQSPQERLFLGGRAREQLCQQALTLRRAGWSGCARDPFQGSVGIGKLKRSTLGNGAGRDLREYRRADAKFALANLTGQKQNPERCFLGRESLDAIRKGGNFFSPAAGMADALGSGGEFGE